LGLAKLYLDNPVSENLDRAEEFANKAKDVANRSSIWRSGRDQYIKEADEVLAKITVFRTKQLSQFVFESGLLWSPAVGKMDWHSAEKYCSSASFKGRSDWRLPLPYEVKSLSQSNILSSVNNYSEWKVANVWTSQPSTSGSHQMVWLDNAVSSSNQDSDSNYATCVIEDPAARANAPKKEVEKEYSIKTQLSKLSSEEYESITSACLQSSFAGKNSYDSCLLKHLKTLDHQKSNLSLDSLSEDQKKKVEINCSEDKFTNGPAAYKKCISTQLKQLEAK
jgi:hypothetical protein